MVNLATYVGSIQAGFLGAVIATLAVVLPSFIIILLVMIALKNLLKNKYMQAILRGLKPCIIGIILATGVFMMLNNTVCFAENFAYDVRSIVLAITLATVMFALPFLLKKKVSPIILMIISAVCGIVIYGI